MKHLQESEDLEARVLQLRQSLMGGGINCSDFMSKEVLDGTSLLLSAQSAAAKAVATFTSSDVLPCISAAVSAMEAPRSEMMSSFAEECSGLESCIDKGLRQIKDKATVSARMADELHVGMKSTENEFIDTIAVERRKEITETKSAFLTWSADHVEFANGIIRRSGEGSTKAASSAEKFVKVNLSCLDEVEAVPERCCIPYSVHLSSTPSEEVILKRVGKDASSVLRALSPNGGSGKASGGNKKAYIGSAGKTLPNFAHERNEPRSEMLA
jgi:hypothetical protein